MLNAAVAFLFLFAFAFAFLSSLSLSLSRSLSLSLSLSYSFLIASINQDGSIRDAPREDGGATMHVDGVQGVSMESANTVSVDADEDEKQKVCSQPPPFLLFFLLFLPFHLFESARARI